MTNIHHPHLLVYISGHGYGHAAQVTPILNRLQQQLPQLRITIKTVVAEQYLIPRIGSKFRYIAEASDFGMVMASALDVLAEDSMRAYVDFHRDWDTKIAAESKKMAALSPDLVLSDVAYLPLAAAACLDIPAVATCSLNWADIFRHYCGNMPEAGEILAQIERAYLRSQAFLKPVPAMPMPWLVNQVAIGPVAQPGRNRRAEINHRLGLSDDARLVLVSMGGIAMRLPIENWPTVFNVIWLVQADWLDAHKRRDMLALESLDMSFSELFASSDLMLTKPGYGAFVEAACNGIPVLYVERDGWPEQAYLTSWLEEYGLCRKLDARQVRTGDFRLELQQLLSQPKPEAVIPSGVDEAAGYIVNMLVEKS